MLVMTASLTAVLGLAFLLAIETFVVPIVALACLVTREVVTGRQLVAVGLALGASAVAYVGVVVLVGLVL